MGTLNLPNMKTLNTHVATSLEHSNSESCSMVVKLYDTCHQVTISKLNNFAEHKVKKYTFCALHIPDAFSHSFC